MTNYLPTEFRGNSVISIFLKNQNVKSITPYFFAGDGTVLATSELKNNTDLKIVFIPLFITVTNKDADGLSKVLNFYYNGFSQTPITNAVTAKTTIFSPFYPGNSGVQIPYLFNRIVISNGTALTDATSYFTFNGFKIITN